MPARVKRVDGNESSFLSGSSFLSQLKSRAAETPAQVVPAAFWGRAALVAALCVWSLRLVLMDVSEGGVGQSFLHGPLLVFHEAGHVLFMPFGEFLTVAGGTLGQLLMPGILCAALLFKNRDPFGASIGLWFLGVSFLDVAPYAYDALHPQLMLLGGRTGDDGGPHDWIYLLSEMGLLRRAHGIAYLFYFAGVVTILTSLAWGAWLLKRQHSRLQSRDDAPNLRP